MHEFYKLKIEPAIRLILIAGLFIYSTNIVCQESAGISYLKLADSLLKLKDYEQSKFNYKKAKDHFFAENDWKNWSLTYRGIRKIAYSTKDRNTTVDSLKVYYHSLPESEWNIRRRCHSGRAYNLAKLGLETESLEEYKNAYEILMENNPTDTTVALSYMRSISYAYSALGDQVTSLKFINNAFDLAQKSRNQREICKLLRAKAAALFHDDRNSESLNVYKLMNKECGESVSSYCKIAEVFLHNNRLDSTSYFLDLAYTLIENKNIDNWEYDIYLYYKSEFLAFQNFYQEAIAIKKSLLKKLKHSVNKRQYIKDLVRLAQLQEKSGGFEDMIANTQKALANNYPEMDSIDIFSRPGIMNDLPDIWVIEALYLKAKYFRNKFEKDNSDIQSNEESIFYHQLIFKLFDQLKSRYDSNSSMYRIGNHTRAYYEGIVNFYCTQFLINNSEDDFERGFAFSQQANAYVLKNAITERQALDIAGTSQDSIDRYTKLKQLAINGQNTDDILKFEMYKKGFAEKLNYFRDEIHNDVISTTEVQGILKNDELLLKYFYANKELFVFKISKHAKEINQIQLPLEFDSLINRHQFLISNSSRWDESEYKSVSYEIYNILLANCLSGVSVNDNINHLIIIPDGPLKKISFSSVIKDDVENYIQPTDYLINDYEISYLYYAAQIRNVGNKSKGDKDEFISFGIEYDDAFLKEILTNYENSLGVQDKTRTFSLSKLAFADDEAKNIAEILDGDYLTNSEVTKPIVQELIKKYNMLHFSAHAFVDLDSYLDSYLVLNRSNSEQYKLSYKDILNMGLNSDFVALSACQTASGLDISGEGLMSLSRAFIQSGCASTLSSYWNASDKATMDIMGLFYSQLTDGKSKSSSLRNAQLEYLRNDNISVPSTRSPFYWSSWAIYGDNSELQKNSLLSNLSSFNVLICLVAAFIIALLGFIFVRNRKLV